MAGANNNRAGVFVLGRIIHYRQCVVVQPKIHNRDNHIAAAC